MDTFHLIVAYNVSRIRDIYVEVIRDYYTFKLAQKTTDIYGHSLVIRNQIEYLVDRIESKLVYLGSNEISLGRTYIPRVKRGLINGLGSIVKAITGNLDQENAVRLETQIQEIRRLAVNRQNQTLGIMSELFTEYHSKLEVIVKNQRELKKTIDKLINQSETLINDVTTMQIYNQIETCLQQLYDRASTLENAITFCHLGRLHPSIVEPSHLIAELGNIQKDIEKNDVQLPYAPSLKNIHVIEKSIVVKAYSTNESITFVLEIPLVTKHPYKLLHLYPIPNKNNAILIPMNPYLLLGGNEFAYPHEPCTSITEEDVLCRHLQWHQLKDSQDCIVQLLQHHEPDNCTYATANFNDTIIQQIRENSWIVILKQEEVFKTTCGDKVQYQRNDGVALITVDKECTVDVAGKSLRTHKRFINIMESIPLPKTSNIKSRKDAPITLQIEDVPLDDLKDLLKKTKVIQPEPEEPMITPKPSWLTVCVYIGIAAVVMWFAARRYKQYWKRSPATPEVLQLQSHEPLQQQSPACFTLKGGGVI